MKNSLVSKAKALLFAENRYTKIAGVIIVLIISFFTFFYGYQKPAALFWDENYHIASAEKYIQGVMFMESHPPLGKLLIALGEVLLSPNGDVDKSAFVATDHISQIPVGMSFAGYRLFPVLFAACAAVLFFLVLLCLTKSSLFSIMGTFLYLFDNALIVHFRGAMLDGIQLFFIFCGLLVFLYAIREGKKPAWIHYALLGLFYGLAIAVKLNSAILLPLFLIMFGYEHWAELKNIREEFLVLAQKAMFRVLQSAPVVLLVFFLVFGVHVGLGHRVEQDRFYKASAEYTEILRRGGNLSLAALPVMFGDNFRYMNEYHEGVPVLDLAKPGENGSHPYSWPLGGRAINYRWEKSGDGVRYLYLMGNPAVWTIGLAGIILGTVLVLGRFVFKMPVTNRRFFNLVMLFLFLYFSYMCAMIFIDRVMYLYHYFIPLQFSLFTAFLIFYYIYEEHIKNRSLKLLVPVVLILFVIFKTYLFVSPFTYYGRLTAEQFKSREWSSVWGLEHVE